jgi:outer membrane protein OmpA-like peptidoglycan-associated protein
VEARRVYTRASEGQARQLVPADLLFADQTLQQAERSFLDSPESPATRDLAYLATRRAQIAEAKAQLAADGTDRAVAMEEMARLQGEHQARTEKKLSQAEAALAWQQSIVASKDQQLTEAQRARMTAERQLRLALASLEKVAAVKEEARGLVITLNGSVLFATNKADLLPIAEDRLTEVAKALADNPNRAIVVEGHTDSTGSVSLNDDLSKRRAESVRDYLIRRGIPADRVRAVGIGSRRPVADNATPEGRANNRRVEIILEPAAVRSQ